MIRPVSEQQMHSRRALGCPKKPEAKPFALALALDTAPDKPTLLKPTLPQPKSPVKKHLQHAWATAPPAPVAPRARASSSSSGAQAETEASPLAASHGPLRATRRASVLQAVLQLLDQDVHALEGAREVLQAAAALPLGEPSVQQACVRALLALQAPGVPPMPSAFVSSSPGALHQATRPATTALDKLSGRARGAEADGSLHRCREFLLACANEIHELEEEHSAAFDYAEDTASTSDVQTERGLSTSPKPVLSSLSSLRFDYASTARGSCSCSCSRSGSSLDDDDVRADQGSQFSDVLLRAEYLSEDDGHEAATEDDDDASAPSSRAAGPVSPAARLATKFRAFHALKRQATLKRKAQAFARLKARLLSPRAAPIKPTSVTRGVQRRPATTLLAWLVRHPDALLLVLALAVLAHVPAHYLA